jgi:hypothetical protein
MKVAVFLAAALALQTATANPDGPPIAQPKYMRYLRALDVPQGTGQACAVLDAEVFPHAAPSLIDLRVFPTSAAGSSSSAASSQSASAVPHEIPYAITLSESASQETTQTHLLNLGIGAGAAHTISFDLAMPERPYSSVTLDVNPALHDFLGTATVTASDALGGKGHSVSFGSFTIFDLTAQHLSRSTTLPLPESTFPYLHISLSMADAPGAHGSQGRFVPSIVTGATVPPSREAQAIYTTVAETSAITTSRRESIAKFDIPARVPVERIEFVVAPTYKSNFSRDVRLTATAAQIAKGSSETSAAPDADGGSMDADQRPSLPETLTGTILRVHSSQAGREINTEQLTLPAVLGANLQRAAKVEVAVENGDDQPLPIAAVRLEMRQRRLCFDTAAVRTAPLALYYGDPTLSAPVYDYERLFSPAEKPLAVTLGPQLANPDFTPRPGAPLSFIERHPEVLWIALIAAIAALGFVAVRSGKRVG